MSPETEEIPEELTQNVSSLSSPVITKESPILPTCSVDSEDELDIRKLESGSQPKTSVVSPENTSTGGHQEIPTFGDSHNASPVRSDQKLSETIQDLDLERINLLPESNIENVFGMVTGGSITSDMEDTISQDVSNILNTLDDSGSPQVPSSSAASSFGDKISQCYSVSEQIPPILLSRVAEKNTEHDEHRIPEVQSPESETQGHESIHKDEKMSEQTRETTSRPEKGDGMELTAEENRIPELQSLKGETQDHKLMCKDEEMPEQEKDDNVELTEEQNSETTLPKEEPEEKISSAKRKRSTKRKQPAGKKSARARKTSVDEKEEESPIVESQELECASAEVEKEVEVVPEQVDVSEVTLEEETSSSKRTSRATRTRAPKAKQASLKRGRQGKRSSRVRSSEMEEEVEETDHEEQKDPEFIDSGGTMEDETEDILEDIDDDDEQEQLPAKRRKTRARPTQKKTKKPAVISSQKMTSVESVRPVRSSRRAALAASQAMAEQAKLEDKSPDDSPDLKKSENEDSQ